MHLAPKLVFDGEEIIHGRADRVRAEAARLRHIDGGGHPNRDFHDDKRAEHSELVGAPTAYQPAAIFKKAGAI